VVTQQGVGVVLSFILFEYEKALVVFKGAVLSSIMHFPSEGVSV